MTQVYALFLSSMVWTTPLRAHLPFILFFLLLMLRSTVQQCGAECGATAAASSVGSGMSQAAGAAAACVISPTAGAAAEGSCGIRDAAAGLAHNFYGTVAGWIRLSVPPVRLLPSSWRRGAGGCLRTCYATLGWLQVGCKSHGAGSPCRCELQAVWRLSVCAGCCHCRSRSACSSRWHCCGEWRRMAAEGEARQATLVPHASRSDTFLPQGLGGARAAARAQAAR